MSAAKRPSAWYKFAICFEQPSGLFLSAKRVVRSRYSVTFSTSPILQLDQFDCRFLSTNCNATEPKPQENIKGTLKAARDRMEAAVFYSCVAFQCFHL